MKGTKQYGKDEIEKRIELLKSAREKRSLESEQNDGILLKHIYKYPGKTLREIEEFFSSEPDQNKIFARSYLLNALKRLENDDAIYFQTEEKQGKILKRFFYKHIEPNPEKIILTVTELEKIFNLEFNSLLPKIRICALNDNAICITTINNQEILDTSLLYEIPEINLINDQVEIYFPKKIINFYRLHQRNFYMTWKNRQNQIILELKTIPEQFIQTKKKIHDVIILEDDDDYREILTEGLKDANYNPIPIKDDVEFLKEITKLKNVDYLVADDEIKGTKMARAMFFILQNKFPNVKGGLISGGSRNASEETALLDAGFTCIFQKGKPKIRTSNPTEICDELIKHLEDLSHD